MPLDMTLFNLSQTMDEIKGIHEQVKAAAEAKERPPRISDLITAEKQLRIALLALEGAHQFLFFALQRSVNDPEDESP